VSGTLFRALQAFIHNVAGNVATVTDARRKVTTFAYDLLNWQSTRMNQARFATQFAYDTRDNLTGTTNPTLQAITRLYDDLSRLTAIITTDNTIGLAQDKAGNPTDRDNRWQALFYEHITAPGLTAADFNGDGDPNVAATGNAIVPHAVIYLFENNHAGGLYSPVPLRLATGFRASNVMAKNKSHADCQLSAFMNPNVPRLTRSHVRIRNFSKWTSRAFLQLH